MNRWTITAATLFALASSSACPALAITAVLPPEMGVNRGVVELETASGAGISVRIAEDLANLIDDGSTRRVLPVIGKGTLQNITDLKLLRGIDMAILQTDVLDYARQQNLFPGTEASASYITKLYNEEFHLLAGQNVSSVADLANQKVNLDLRGAGTAITAGRLFELLSIPAIATNDNQEVALDKLRRGEIAAIAFVAGKAGADLPQPRCRRWPAFSVHSSHYGGDGELYPNPADQRRLSGLGPARPSR